MTRLQSLIGFLPMKIPTSSVRDSPIYVMTEFKFSFADVSKGIVTFDVTIGAASQEEAVKILVKSFVEFQRKCSQPIDLTIPSSDPLKVGRALFRRLSAITDPLAFIVTVHLFTEHWLNEILLRFCPHEDLTSLRYADKLRVVKGIGKLPESLSHNLRKLNELRNKVAHKMSWQ